MMRPGLWNQLRYAFGSVLGKGRRRKAAPKLQNLKPQVELLERRELLTVTPLGGDSQLNFLAAGVQRLGASGMPLAVASDGGLLATWTSIDTTTGNADIYARRFTGRGEALGQDFVVNTTTAGSQDNASAATAADGTSLLVWQSDGQDGSGLGVFGQRLDGEGNRLGSEFQVNLTTSGDQRTPVVAALSDGSFVVVWSGPGPGDPTGVFARIFASDGTPQTNEIRVNSTTHSAQRMPVVAALPGGGFVVAWNAHTNQSLTDVLAQRFDASGNRVGAEFIVNTTHESQQDRPAVAVDAAGNFAIAWQSKRQDTSRWAICAQRYAADGSPLGEELLVNTTFQGDQQNPSITFDSMGGFVVSWNGQGAGDTSGIFARQYNATGQPQGNEFLVNETTEGVQTSSAVRFNRYGYALAWSGCTDGVAEVFSRRFGMLSQVIVDDGGVGYRETGTGWSTLANEDSYGGSSRVHAPSTKKNKATWTFEGMAPSKSYQVWATWAADPAQASNAPFTVYDDTKVLRTARLDQRLAASQLVVDGRGWQQVGTFFSESGRLVVELSDDADGLVSADAIRVVDPEVWWDSDNDSQNGFGGAGAWESGYWWDPTANGGQGGYIPWADGYDAVFDDTAGIVTISSSITASSIRFETDGYTLAQGTNGSIGDSTSGITFYIQTNVAATVDLPLTCNYGLLQQGSGTLTITDSATLGGTSTISTGTFNINGGTLSLSTSSAQLNNDATMTLQSGTVTISNDSSLYPYSGLCNNTGATLNLQSGGLGISSGAALNNAGAVTVSGGILSNYGKLYNDGWGSSSITVSGGTVYNYSSGTIDNNKYFTVSGSTSTVSISNDSSLYYYNAKLNELDCIPGRYPSSLE